jgi:hypothetical protein
VAESENKFDVSTDHEGHIHLVIGEKLACLSPHEARYLGTVLLAMASKDEQYPAWS